MKLQWWCDSLCMHDGQYYIDISHTICWNWDNFLCVSPFLVSKLLFSRSLVKDLTSSSSFSPQKIRFEALHIESIVVENCSGSFSTRVLISSSSRNQQNSTAYCINRGTLMSKFFIWQRGTVRVRYLVQNQVSTYEG